MKQIPNPLVHAVYCLLVMLLSSVAVADLEKARLLYDAQLYDDAKRELVATATSDADPEEKAAALHLLGTIAVDEKRYDAAVRTWSDLVAKYPDTEDAEQAKDKISLVQALGGTEDHASTPVPAAESPEPALRGVIVANAGMEKEWGDFAVDEISNFLIGSSVVASKAPDGIGTLEMLKPLASAPNATSILILTMKFGYMESLRAECYSADGNLEWKEKASGSWGISRSGVAAGLINRIKKKLEDHLGDSCLPKSG